MPVLFLNMMHLFFVQIISVINENTLATVITSIFVAFLVWFVFNICLTPKLEISDIRYDKNRKPYIRVCNKSWFFRAYEVYCHISYYVEGDLVYKRTDNIIPVLKCVCNKLGRDVKVKLAQSNRTNQVFEEKGKIVLQIVVTGQNKFGVKRVYSQKIVIED